MLVWLEKVWAALPSSTDIFCVIGSAEFRGLRVGDKGNCGPSLAFLELAVSLTLGAIVKRLFMLVPDIKN